MKLIQINISDLSITQETELMDKLHEFFPLVAFDDETVETIESTLDSIVVAFQPQEVDVISRALLALKTLHYTEEDKEEDLTSTEMSLLNSNIAPIEKTIIRSLYNTNFDWDGAMLASDEDNEEYFKNYK